MYWLMWAIILGDEDNSQNPCSIISLYNNSLLDNFMSSCSITSLCE